VAGDGCNVDDNNGRRKLFGRAGLRLPRIAPSTGVEKQFLLQESEIQGMESSFYAVKDQECVKSCELDWDHRAGSGSAPQ